MTNRETNYFEMAKRVLAVLKKHLQKFTGKTAMLNYVADLETSVNKVSATNLAYKNSTKGKTSAKSSAVDDLISALMPIKGALFAYASKVKNHELKAITEVSESELHRMRKSEMVEKATSIEQAANENSAVLADSGTNELLAVLHTKIINYDSLNEEKETSMTNRSSLRKALTSDFDELELLLSEQGDSLIELVRKDYPDVYNEYFAARVIKDLGGSHGNSDDEDEENRRKILQRKVDLTPRSPLLCKERGWVKVKVVYVTQHFNRSTEKALRRQLRQDQTYCEEIVWTYLRNRKTGGCKFRRQYSIDKYVVDFYCPLLRLAIEIDGSVHNVPENKLNDIDRQSYIELYGIEFLRITNDELLGNPNKAFERIEDKIMQL